MTNSNSFPIKKIGAVFAIVLPLLGLSAGYGQLTFLSKENKKDIEKTEWKIEKVEVSIEKKIDKLHENIKEMSREQTILKVDIAEIKGQNKLILETVRSIQNNQ